MKSVLVTGAGGFIGSNLVRELVKQGYTVKAFVRYNSRNSWGNLELLAPEIRSNIEVYLGNIEDQETVQNAVKGCDTVLHLAALIAIPYSYMAPESYIDTNIKGTLNILRASIKSKVSKVVHTSTSETYGTAMYTPIDEGHPLQGQSPYSASKIGADKIAESFYRSFDLPVAIIRPFNTYGMYQSARAVIPTIITQALSTTSKQIELGSLSPIRDLTYVKDVADAFIKMAHCDRCNGEVVNVGSGKGITIHGLAQKIIEIINPEIGIVKDTKRIRPEKSEVMELICDNKKARELLTWKPAYSLREGLKETIAFMREHMHLYKPNQYTI